MPAEIDVHEQPHVSTPPGWVQTVSDLIHEFFVDLLAILLPGMVFTLFIAALLIASGACLLDVFRPDAQPVASLGDLLKGQISASVVWLLAIFGYVIGGTFFRQDPKLPDLKSIKRVLKGSPRSDRKRAEVQLGPNEQQDWTDAVVGRKEAAIIANSQGAQFPYSHLKDYLEARGFSYLADKVPWSGTEFSIRSKMFINALKIRLDLVAPAKCGTIVRNEAHVRMMSSIWFASRALIYVCCLSTLPVLAAILRFSASLHEQSLFSAMRSVADGLLSSQDYKSLPMNAPSFYHDFMVYLVLLLSAVVSAHWIQAHVEKCFHYQRVREVFYVLETAFC
ncbi:MAG: hypothetical protein ABR898_12810, partial [Terracidiphilus sp.]